MNKFGEKMKKLNTESKINIFDVTNKDSSSN